METRPPRMPTVSVFFLYSTDDASWASRMKPYIPDTWACLFDPHHHVRPGENVAERVMGELRAADLVVAFFTPALLAALRDPSRQEGPLFALVRQLPLDNRFIVNVRAVNVPENDPVCALLQPDTPLALVNPVEDAIDWFRKTLALKLLKLREEINEPQGPERDEGDMHATETTPRRPRSGDMLLSRYRLVERVRHDALLSEWVAVDEGERRPAGDRRTVLLHLLGTHLSDPASDEDRSRLFRRVSKLAAGGLAGLGEIIEPHAADGQKHFFVTSNVWQVMHPGYGAALSLYSAATRRQRGIAWIPLLLQVGARLSELHDTRVEGVPLAHGAVSPRNIVVDVPGGPVLVGMNILGGIATHGSADIEDGHPSFQPERAAADPDPAGDIHAFAATVVFTLLGGKAQISWLDACEAIPHPAIRDALRQAFDSRPEHRYRRIDELCEKLRSAYVAITGPIPCEMITVEAGETWMGRPDGDDLARPQEMPRRRVRVSGFSIARDIVPQSLFTLVMGGNPGILPWGEEVPATRVSFIDAVELCNRLSRLYGKTAVYEIDGAAVSWDRRADGFRLPTEAEWEYAAVGPCPPEEEPRLYPWGSEEVAARACWNGDGHGHKGSNERGPCSGGKHEGGESAFRLRDMAGGVCEWCWDWFRPYEPLRPGSEPLQDPVGPSRCVVPDGYPKRPYRMVRGGAWNQKAARWLRASARYIEDQHERALEIGVRLACGPVPIPPGEDPVVH